MPDQTITTAKRSAPSHEASDAPTIALQALAWIVSDSERCSRFLAMTGLEGGDLRARIGDPALQSAVLGFLTGHEADLLACAEALDLAPEAIAAAARALGA